ncbi:hypothetical protein EYW49_08010 [Siculibacillus lacustris]|uniref:Uncharacterized protein n=1 Tax=Siculibacillus lacustris TaxID=1549641 RepID=A0A4Q9VS44_9HYPH|nr:hypothetical protein [Siculibacillus lacustris]TBW38635.1 hypothetical protein EYW49_08010 [Siculibacillus lacustris]
MPKELEDALDCFVSDYLSQYGAGGTIDPCANCWCDGEIPMGTCLSEGISFAVRSICVNGTKHSHQFRIKKIDLIELEQRLLNMVKIIEDVNSFEELYKVIENENLAMGGPKPLLTYDTATRISRHHGFEPKFVYLHCGAKEGARLLGIRGKVVDPSVFPSPIRRLTAAQIEDFLCRSKSKIEEFLLAGKHISLKS